MSTKVLRTRQASGYEIKVIDENGRQFMTTSNRCRVATRTMFKVATDYSRQLVETSDGYSIDVTGLFPV